MVITGKQKGFALLGMVVTTFIALALISAVMFAIASQTKKTEIWEMKYKRQQLSLLARSAINMTAEAIADDKLTDLTLNNPLQNPIQINDGQDKDNYLRLQLAVSGDFGSLVRIKATAKTTDDKTAVIMTGIYDKDSQKIVRWITGND